ncbi:MAG: hypothetical protein Q8907_10255 [Bacteroidota bacterium]|nr:hypothetical protein [Bacteroidota bacterium]
MTSQKVYKKECDCVIRQLADRLLAACPPTGGSASFRQYAVNKDFVYNASRRKVLGLFN